MGSQSRRDQGGEADAAFAKLLWPKATFTITEDGFVKSLG